MKRSTEYFLIYGGIILFIFGVSLGIGGIWLQWIAVGMFCFAWGYECAEEDIFEQELRRREALRRKLRQTPNDV